jgi:hypothetical protein
MTRFHTSLLILLATATGYAAPVPANSSDWVTLKGALIWPVKAEIPERKDLSKQVTSDREYTLAAGPLLDDTLLVHKKNRGVKNVIVWLRPDSDDRDAKFPADKIHPDVAKPKPTTHRVEMEHCRYTTRVLAIRGGDKLEAVNKGTVAENFNLQGTAVDLNVTLPPTGKPVVSEPIPAEKGTLLFRCDIHPWMSGRLRVFDHPYFAVTDENGEFEIKRVPKGKWRIVHLHDLGFHWGYDGRLGFPVEIKDEGQGVMRMKVLEYEAMTRPLR